MKTMKGVKVMTAKEAVSLIKDGDGIVTGVFYQAGFPVDLGDALAEKGTKDLVLTTNDPGLPGVGVGKWVANGQIKHLMCSYPGTNKDAMALIREGKLSTTIFPQGTLAEMLRALGAGIGGFYVRTGLDAYNDMREKNISLPPNIFVFFGHRKETLAGEREWLFFQTPKEKPKFALIRAEEADTRGNLLFRGTATNFGPISAGCAEIVIAEVDKIVKPGELIPGPYDIILPANYARNKILVKSSGRKISPWVHKGAKGGDIDLGTFLIVKRAIKEIKPGDVINPGIGIPSNIREQREFREFMDGVLLQVECGALGIGPRPALGPGDPNFIDAAGEPFLKGGGLTVFHSADAFCQIRGGKVPKVFLGALQVGMKSAAETGKADLSNWWMYDGDKIKKDLNGIGGAMDLCAGVKDNPGTELIVLMKHTGPKGEHKILSDYTFPVTAKAVVSKIITDKCVIKITKKGPVVAELMPGETFERVQASTGTGLVKAKNIKNIKMN